MKINLMEENKDIQIPIKDMIKNLAGKVKELKYKGGDYELHLQQFNNLPLEQQLLILLPSSQDAKTIEEILYLNDKLTPGHPAIYNHNKPRQEHLRIFLVGEEGLYFQAGLELTNSNVLSIYSMLSAKNKVHIAEWGLLSNTERELKRVNEDITLNCVPFEGWYHIENPKNNIIRKQDTTPQISLKPDMSKYDKSYNMLLGEVGRETNAAQG